LAKQNEISSTERLLDLIRSESQEGFADSAFSSQKPAGRMRPFLRSPISFRRNITVGVDIGYDDLKLVKIKHVSEKTYELLEYAKVPFNPEIPRESPNFYTFLRPTLSEFCGSVKSMDIWCTISSARVETRQFRIPKVPARQIPNAIYWTYQREAAFDEKEKVFDFEILGEVQEEQTTKINVLAYTVPADEVASLKDMFAKAGFHLSGISIVPFAFQTLLRARRVELAEQQVASLYIGRDWSRIDIFSGGNLLLSRGIKAGVRTMMEGLRKEIESSSKGLTLVKAPDEEVGRIRAVKKKLKLDLELAQKFFFGYTPGAVPEDEAGRKLSINEDKIFLMIQPALERLVRQVERTIRHFALNYENTRISKIFISSGVSPHRKILSYIGEELGMPTEVLNPFSESANFVHHVPVPDSLSEQSSFAPAMGMALANNSRTPNFLFTYKDKGKDIRNRRINRSVFAAFLILIAACVGISLVQEREIAAKDAQKMQLQQHLQGYNLRVDKELILKLVQEIREKNRADQTIGKKYLGLAVISEAINLTPSNIRLLSIATQLGPLPDNTPQKEEKSKKQPAEPPPGVLILEGIVQGDRLTLESALASYLMELKESKLFDQPAISNKSFGFSGNDEVLRFTAKLNLAK
jgi:type IV pilus assembly protein PilM